MLRRFAAQRSGTGPAQRRWQALVASLAGLDRRAQIAAADAALNRVPYVASWVNWRAADRWETPFEFLARGGQCQDYAVAKYLLLRAAGVPAAALRVVVVRDDRLGVDHAVAVAYVGGEPFVLDNLRAAVTPAGAGGYRPYYSLSELGWWRHGGPNAAGAGLR